MREIAGFVVAGAVVGVFSAAGEQPVRIRGKEQG
jgi:hypothetical protein